MSFTIEINDDGTIVGYHNSVPEVMVRVRATRESRGELIGRLVCLWIADDLSQMDDAELRRRYIISLQKRNAA